MKKIVANIMLVVLLLSIGILSVMEILGFRLTIQGAVGQSTTDLQNYSSYSGDKWNYYWYIEDNGDFADFAIVRKILFFRKNASKATNYYELLDSDNKCSCTVRKQATENKR